MLADKPPPQQPVPVPAPQPAPTAAPVQPPAHSIEVWAKQEADAFEAGMDRASSQRVWIFLEAAKALRNWPQGKEVTQAQYEAAIKAAKEHVPAARPRPEPPKPVGPRPAPGTLASRNQRGHR
jgi:hypothetical protein